MNTKWHLRGRQVSICAIVMALAACSTADYGKPVNDFAAATGEAEKALSQLNAQITTAYAGVLKNSVMSGRAFLRTESDNCLTTSERCRLEVVGENGQAEPYPPEPPLVQMTLVMSEINTYAANLKALLDADTAQQVESQVNATLGSIQNIAETVAEASTDEGAPPAEVPAFATPAGAAVNWVVGQYVESVKFKGLQRATEAAKPVVRAAADLFTVTSTFASDIPKSELAEEVSKAVDAFRAQANEANFTNVATRAATYDALLTSAPPQLFQRMGDAHDALAESLQGEGLTFATAVARIEAFAAEARKVVKILNDLRALVPEEQDGGEPAAGGTGTGTAGSGEG